MTNLRNWIAVLFGSTLSVTVGGQAIADCHRVGGSDSGSVPTFALGSRFGDCVKRMQDQLTKKGIQIEPTGTFDAKTEAAVKKFQTEMGLSKVDGKVGPETRKALGWER